LSIFKFIVDEKEEFQVKISVNFGDIDSFISMSTYKEGAFDKIRGSGTLYYTPGSEKFKTANTYFLIIENNGKEVSDFDVLVTQNHTVVEVTNGVPLKTTFSDERDVSKAFMMKLPKGESELTLQIQPLVTNYKLS